MLKKFTLEDAVSKKYFIWRENNAALKEYYHYCLANNLPLVRFRAMTKYATLEVDCLDIFVKLSEEAANEIHELFLRYTHSKYWGRSTGDNISYLHMKKIPVEKMDEMGEKVVAILEKPGYVRAYERVLA